MSKPYVSIEDPNSKDNLEKLEKSQRWVFGATFINYAMAHWTRKSYTNVKMSFIHAGVSPLTLAAMDSGFMFTYAGGSFITGQLGDRFSPVLVIGIGLLGSTFCLFLIVIGVSTSIVTNAALCSTFFFVCQMMHGLFQATGGPVNTAIMGNWFTAKNRGLTFGLWTCHQYVGDIVAALASAYILYIGWDWRLCMIIPAVVNGIWAIINIVSVPNRPEDAGIITEASKAQNIRKNNASSGGPAVSEPEPIGFFQAFLLPNVLSYALAFGFFKLVNYAMFFQLPVILSTNFSPSTANMISSLYSVGMMPGGIVCGWVSDLYGGRRACVIATFMSILCPLLLVFAYFMDSLSVMVILSLLTFMGCLVGGPNNIITSAVAADLADDPSIKGNNRALGTVTGIINGSGSITAAFGQMAIPILFNWGNANMVGYRYVWLFLILCTMTGTALMGPSIYKELYPPRPTENNIQLTTSTHRGYQSVAQDDSKI